MFALVTSWAAGVFHGVLAVRFLWHAILHPRPLSSLGSIVCASMPVGWVVVVFLDFNQHDVRDSFPSILTILAFWAGAVPLAVLFRLDRIKPYPHR